MRFSARERTDGNGRISRKGWCSCMICSLVGRRLRGLPFDKVSRIESTFEALASGWKNGEKQ